MRRRSRRWLETTILGGIHGKPGERIVLDLLKATAIKELPGGCQVSFPHTWWDVTTKFEDVRKQLEMIR